MAVNFGSNSLQFSNKLSAIPKPKPSYELFPSLVELSDGRTARVSLPLPDRLTLVADLYPGIFGPAVPEGIAIGDWLMTTAHHFQNNYFNSVPLGATYFPSKKWYKDITLGMGDRQSAVRFEFNQATKTKSANLRIEMNPRKLGKKGCKILRQILTDPQGPFDGKALLQAARITRLDVAIDIVGLQTDEIIARIEGEKQRSLYVGADGVLETFYMHGSPTKAKPAGRVLLAVYDRGRLSVKKGKPAPFGPAPVTRIEVARKVSAPNNKMANLPNISDVFAKVSVGHVLDQGVKPLNWWCTYVGLRRTKTHDAAAMLMGLTPKMADQFGAAYLIPNANLVSIGSHWDAWGEGLKYSGLMQLINIAK